MNAKVLLLIATVVFASVTAGSTTLRVPQNYSTVQAAIDAGVNGDTVLVAAGTHHYGASFNGKSIHLISESGAEVTNLLGRIIIEETGQGSCEVSGFSVWNVMSDVIVRLRNTNVVISNNMFYDNTGYETIIKCEGGAPQIVKNLFHHNQVGNACIGVVFGSVRIINNTFDSNSRGFYSMTNETVAMNNIVTNSALYGIHGAFGILSYNDVWNNGINFDNAVAGPTDISVDPLYEAPALGDYRLRLESPCINGGYPSEEFLDPDGTRNDIGAFYRPSNYPLGGRVKVGSTINERVPESFPMIVWQFLDWIATTQHEYELQIGSDREWSVAELWSTGVITSADTFVQYAGPALVDGTSYWGRLRVSNGQRWGDWNEFRFRANVPPSALNLMFPPFGGTVSPTGLWFKVENSIDSDLDELSYTFEVYTEQVMNNLVSAQTELKSQGGITYSEFVAGLESNRFYWWRARVTDGYEYSAWTSASLFVTKTCQVIRVPQDQPGIQSALDAATDGDTVLVAPGVYTELLTFPNKGVKLISAEGAEVTQLARPIWSDPYVSSIRFAAPTTREGEVKGFRIDSEVAYQFIEFEAGTEVTFQENIFRNLICETAIMFAGDGYPLIKRNVFERNVVGWYCIEALGPCEIINNTFDHNSKGVYSSDRAAKFYNNIVSNSTEYGVAGEFSAHDYNLIWNNYPNYNEPFVGAHEISLDPEFIDSAGGDTRLRPGSPCIDGGDPAPEYNDPDGSRNDIGAYPFIDVFPMAYGVTVGMNGNTHVVDPTPAISWQYIDDAGLPQAKAEVEAGSDLDWDTAEMWESGEVELEDYSIDYAGSILAPGASYYVRIRLNNGTNWGDWREVLFRRNSKPNPPTLNSPTNFAETPWLNTRLEIFAASDAEGDELSYDYAVYASDSLIEPIYEVMQTPSTITGPVPNLEAGPTYWWRARAFDGYEYSDWSAAATFTTRGNEVRRVPETYASIQQAIIYSQHGDTILVSPGTYSGTIDLQSKVLVITSSGGPEVTHLTPSTSALVTFKKSEVPGKVEFSGFTVRSFTGFVLIRVTDGSSPLIKNLRLLGSNCTVLIQVENGSPTISHNLLANNTVGSAAIGVNAGAAIIENNTVEDNSRGIYSFSSESIVRNNIVSNSFEYGFYGQFGVLDYNNAWRNFPNYTNPDQVGIHSIEVDPRFRNTGLEDYRLSMNSPCIDAGDPAEIFNDSDGSRNDLGAYPFVRHYPSSFGLLAPANQTSSAITSVFPTFAWSEAENSETALPIDYYLQISSDSDFVFLQSIGPLDSCSFQPVTALDWGTRYWWKVKAAIEDEGESWSNEVFAFRTMTLGDADGSGRLNITDIVYLINYLFAGGPAPEPAIVGDVNCSGRINIGDAVYLVNYIFGDGPLPCSDFPTISPAKEAEPAIIGD